MVSELNVNAVVRLGYNPSGRVIVKTIRQGSFFSKSKLTLQKWLLMLYLWVRNYPVTDAAEEAEVDAGTAVDIFQWLREVALLATPIVLGGAGVVVQIDESLFRHKPKVSMQLVSKKLIK